MKVFACAALAAAVSATVAEKMENFSGHMPFGERMVPRKEDNSIVTIKENGVEKQLYVIGMQVHGSGADYTIDVGGRGYLSTSPSPDPNQFYRPNLLGGAVEFDVDLSGKECSCIAAFYLVSMPGRNEQGDFWQTDGYYYCDANKVGGNYCPEYDLMEANKFALGTTPHSCDSPSSSGFYYNCDAGGGCPQNTAKVIGGQYGPGNGTIDTNKPFHLKVDFTSENDTLVRAQTILTQEGRTATMTAENCDYLARMSKPLADGMGFAISNWGLDDAWWLTWGTCQGGCDNPVPLTFNNIEITLGSGGGGGGGGGGSYDFGDACEHADDGECGSDCSYGQCKFSWPSGDPDQWMSKDAACRCQR